MDDEQKKFTGKRGPRSGGRGPGSPAAGDRKREGKPFRADDGKRRFEKREGFQKRDGTGAPDKRPFRGSKSAEYGARPEARSGREGRPFRAGRDGKPFEKRPDRDGARAGPPSESGERREWKPRREDADAGARPFRRDGARAFGPKNHEGPRNPQGIRRQDDGSRKSFRKQPGADEGASGERIAKRLARAGIASRRDAEELIAAGRVSVNGRKLDSPAFNVMASDRIEVDGTEIPAIERTRLFLFHKPAGVVTTNHDPEGRRTVFDTLPTDLPRLMTVGRLDINTEGLLLLTNDGGLARVLELPATGWLRRYRARVHGKVDEKALEGLRDGIAVDGVFYGSIEAKLEREQGTNAWLTIGLREGKNREVKNILGALGLDVTRLIRISFGPFQLADLPEGHVLEVKGRMLRDQLGDRLVEESGANFDAPVVNSFPNQPIRRETSREEFSERPKIRRDGERGRIGEGGLIKKRHRREDARDEALDKLSTKPERPKFERGERPERPQLERGERPARGPRFGDSPDRFATFGGKSDPKPRQGRKFEKDGGPIEPPGQRKANVWMAPGARPMGAGRAAAEKARATEKRRSDKPFAKPAYDKPAYDKSGRDRPQAGRPAGARPGSGKAGPRGPGRKGR